MSISNEYIISSIDEMSINRCTYHFLNVAHTTMEYYSAFKRKETLQYVMTGMNLEDTILSEANHRKTNAASFHLNDKSATVDFTKSRSAV
jgi:hypothetical protein